VTDNKRKKVFVSGCFDMLHSGHIAFFEQASTYGDLYVALGSDKTVFDLKGREPVNKESERLYMVKSLSMVKDAFISTGSGMLDFLKELMEIKPDIFLVNTDGNTPDKRTLCEQLNIEYKVLHREPHTGLPPRSTTALRTLQTMPYRIDVAGGWLDQPFVSKKYPGPVITISLEPTIDFNERSGMATSTRRKAYEIWGPKMPSGDYQKIAKMLFCYDNPPGTKEISGSQDAIGLVFPGLAIAHYRGDYWPHKIDSVQDEETLLFIENSLYLIPLGPRESGFSVLENTRITKRGAKRLSEAAYACWDAILAHDTRAFGRYLREGFEAQTAMFPNMVIPAILELIEQYQDRTMGWKVSGAGGGGYLILVSDNEIEDALRVKIRRATD
jgi:cytidyltransferase-like protein